MALTALDFPASPTNGQLYPDPPVTGQPQYSWNGSQWISSKAAVTQIARTDALGWSGMQINGSMEVSQERGTTPTSTFNTYVCDGWKMLMSGTMSIAGSQQTQPYFPGMPWYLSVQIVTPQASIGAGDYAVIYQPIEGYRVARLGWGTANAQPITIGFWSMHQITGVYSVSVVGSSDARSYTATYTHAVSNVAQYNMITIPGDTGGTSWATGNTTGLSLRFVMACGSTFIAPAANTWYGSNYIAAPGQVNGVASIGHFRITGVVVLPGIEAPTAAQSPLIMRPYDQELLTCRRYYFRRSFSLLGYGGTGNPIGQWLANPTPMRAPPTAVWSSGVFTNCSGVTFDQITTEGMRAYVNITSTGHGFADNAMQTVDARL